MRGKNHHTPDPPSRPQVLSVASQMPLDDVLGHVGCSRMKRHVEAVIVTEDVHVIAAVFANELGDVIGALIAAVALAILQRLGRS